MNAATILYWIHLVYLIIFIIILAMVLLFGSVFAGLNGISAVILAGIIPLAINVIYVHTLSRCSTALEK
jgi:hypothetical protein